MNKDDIFNYGIDRLQLLSSDEQDYVVGALTLLRLKFNYEDCTIITESILRVLTDSKVIEKYITEGADA